jgi:cytoskeletal protein CcmA (bactofilin family)
MERLFGVAKSLPAVDDEVDEASTESTSSKRSSFEAEANADALLSKEKESSGRQLSTLGRTLVFKGELDAAEDLLIQGRVEGSISHSGSNLTIGAHGEVTADVDANRVIVQGTVHGDVRATESITIEPSAKVRGNMFAPSIGLKEGAKFKGSIDMDGEPKAASKSNKPETDKTASGGTGAKDGQSKDQELSDQKVADLLD